MCTFTFIVTHVLLYLKNCNLLYTVVKLCKNCDFSRNTKILVPIDSPTQGLSMTGSHRVAVGCVLRYIENTVTTLKKRSTHLNQNCKNTCKDITTKPSAILLRTKF